MKLIVGTDCKSALSGLIVSGFNHTMHQGDIDNPPGKKIRLNHAKALEYFEKELKGFENGIDFLDNVKDWTGDYSTVGIIKDIFSNELKFSLYPMTGTQIKVQKVNLENMKNKLSDIRDRYQNLHKNDTSNLQGIRIETFTYTFPAPSYIGGMGSTLTSYKFYDNYSNKLLGQYESNSR